MLGNKQMLIMIWMLFLSMIGRAQTPVPCGDGLTWNFDEETKTLFIRGEGKMNDFEYNGAPWNDFKDRMQHVVIEEGVNSIGARAFYNSMIEDIEIPATVSEIGEAAFNSCSQLKECVVPPLVTEIKDWTFESCSSLTSVRLMGEVTSIGGWAFSWSEALQQLELPESVTHIGSLAFYNCSQLDLMLPAAVIELGDRALFNTATYNNENNWKDDLLIVGDCLVKARGNRSEYPIPSNIRLIANNAFEGNTGLKTIVVPEGVEIIGDDAFWQCSSLHQVSLPQTSLKFLGREAFRDCASLQEISLPEGIDEIRSWTFYDCTSLVSLSIPESVKRIAYDVVYNTPLLKNSQYQTNGMLIIDDCLVATNKSWLSSVVSIPENVRLIAQEAFANTNVTEVHLPEGIRMIDDCTFSSCKNLRNIQIPLGVTKIGEQAFSSCSSLTNVELPEGITEIGEDAFRWCRSLESINIPESTTFIGSSAFDLCSSLKSIRLPQNLTRVESSSFDGCSSLEQVVLSEQLTYIGDRAFMGTGITSLHLGDKVSYIGQSAFASCRSLSDLQVSPDNPYYLTEDNVLFDKEKTVLKYYAYLKENSEYNIPEGVTAIEMNAMNGNPNLKLVRFPKSLLRIGESAFSGCEQLDSIEWNKALEVIESGAFFACEKLRTVWIPAQIEIIPQGCFMGCSSLEYVVLPKDLEEIGSEAFCSCQSLTRLDLPNKLVKIGDAALSGSAVSELELPASLISLSTGALGYSLKTLKVWYNNPPVVDSYLFPKENEIVLYVPKGTRNTYLQAEVWKDFPTIIEFEGARVYNGTQDPEYITVESGKPVLLPENSNAIALIVTEGFMPAENSKNLILQETDGSYYSPLLELTDQSDFYTPVDFYAQKAMYRRTVPEGSQWGTLVLPFSLNSLSDLSGAALYVPTDMEYTGQEEGCFNISPVDGVLPEAYEPVLFKSDNPGGQLNIQVNGIWVESSEGKNLTRPVGNGGFQLVGTMQTIKSVAQGNFFIAKDCFWKVGQTEVSIHPFRAYLQTAGKETALRCIGFYNDETTRVHEVETESDCVDVYSVDGILIRKEVSADKALEGLPKGYYIVDRKLFQNQ